MFFLAIAVVRGLLNMGLNILGIVGYKINNFLNSLYDTLTSPFRPKPTESDIEDPNYYQATEEKPKRYSEEDGEYIDYKKTKTL